MPTEYKYALAALIGEYDTRGQSGYQLSIEEFIGKFVSHIPDIGFRMIRYYRFLANRLRGKLLP